MESATSGMIQRSRRLAAGDQLVLPGPLDALAGARGPGRPATARPGRARRSPRGRCPRRDRRRRSRTARRARCASSTGGSPSPARRAAPSATGPSGGRARWSRGPGRRGRARRDRARPGRAACGRRASRSPIWPPVSSRSAVAATAAGSTPIRAAAAGSATKPRPGSPPSDSNTALRVPGTVSTRLRTAVPSASSRCTSGANTRMPTGVRTPVAIMSIRPRAGAVQALVQPGSRVARSRPATSSAVVGVVSSGHTRPSALRTGPGAQLEYQRSRLYFGHSIARQQPDRGLGHRVRRRIGRGVGAADLAEHAGDLGELADRAVLAAQHRDRLVGRHAGQRGRHVQQVALVDPRQELAAELRGDRQARQHARARRSPGSAPGGAARSGRTAGRSGPGRGSAGCRARAGSARRAGGRAAPARRSG